MQELPEHEVVALALGMVNLLAALLGMRLFYRAWLRRKAAQLTKHSQAAGIASLRLEYRYRAFSTQLVECLGMLVDPFGTRGWLPLPVRELLTELPGVMFLMIVFPALGSWLATLKCGTNACPMEKKLTSFNGFCRRYSWTLLLHMVVVRVVQAVHPATPLVYSQYSLVYFVILVSFLHAYAQLVAWRITAEAARARRSDYATRIRAMMTLIASMYVYWMLATTRLLWKPQDMMDPDKAVVRRLVDVVVRTIMGFALLFIDLATPQKAPGNKVAVVLELATSDATAPSKPTRMFSPGASAQLMRSSPRGSSRTSQRSASSS